MTSVRFVFRFPYRRGCGSQVSLAPRWRGPIKGLHVNIQTRGKRMQWLCKGVSGRRAVIERGFERWTVKIKGSCVGVLAGEVVHSDGEVTCF